MDSTGPKRRTQGQDNGRSRGTIIDYKIDPDFQGLIPPLMPEERELLKASIEAEGCREPVVVWANHDNTIIDGHTRHAICKELGVKHKVKPLSFDSREEVVKWIIDNQLGRRNLPEEVKSLLRGMRYAGEKQAEGAPKGNTNAAEKQLGHSEQVVSTAGRLAKEYGVSPATIKRDAEFARAVETLAENVGPEAKTAALSGEISKKAVKEVATLPAKEQPAAFEAAKKGEHPKPEPVKVVRTDGRGLEIPAKLLPVFDAVETYRAAQRLLSQAKGLLRELAEGPAGQFLNQQSAEIAMGTAYRDIRFGQPYVVCVYCGAKSKKADCACKGSGFLPKSLYEQAPAELKAEVSSTLER
ncbi:MAG: hypothetical protein ACYC35_01655 [Pirellulales bacterium]